MICLYTVFFGPKLWTPQPHWHDMFVHVFFVQSCGHPNLTGMICLYRFFFSPKCGHSSLTGMICLYTGISSKVVDTPGYLLVVCIFLCSVTLKTFYLVQSDGLSHVAAVTGLGWFFPGPPQINSLGYQLCAFIRVVKRSQNIVIMLCST